MENNGFKQVEQLIFYRLDELKNLYVAGAVENEKRFNNLDEEMKKRFEQLYKENRERKAVYDKRLRDIEVFKDKLTGGWALILAIFLLIGAVAGIVAIATPF